MVLDIVTFPAKSLRNKAKEVKEITPEILELINDMKDTLMAVTGYGLAAPQVGRSVRVIIVDENACRNGKDQIKAYINPVITKKEGEIVLEEGCLSIPDEFAVVKRYVDITFEAIDESGNKVVIEANEQLARILQHETDHLEGILFIDHIPPFKRDTMKKHIKRRIKEGDYITIGD